MFFEQLLQAIKIVNFPVCFHMREQKEITECQVRTIRWLTHQLKVSNGQVWSCLCWRLRIRSVMVENNSSFFKYCSRYSTFSIFPFCNHFFRIPFFQPNHFQTFSSTKYRDKTAIAFIFCIKSRCSISLRSSNIFYLPLGNRKSYRGYNFIRLNVSQIKIIFQMFYCKYKKAYRLLCTNINGDFSLTNVPYSPYAPSVLSTTSK